MPAPLIPYRPARLPPDEQSRRASDFYEMMNRRRSVRSFSDQPVPRRLIEYAIRSASTAPSGAHRQPWTFVLTGDPEIKRQIRVAFLETVPWIVVLFEQRYGLDDDGVRSHHFYVKESCGIAAGLFVAALHTMGLATLTHTPSPMAFLTRVLDRPENERPFCMFPVGYPSEDCVVPDLTRKSLGQVMVEVGTPAAGQSP
jgi:nitroreductase